MPRVGVGCQSEIRQQVLDLLAFVELHRADDLVRDAIVSERFLKQTRLRVGPVQNGNVLVRNAGFEPAHAPGDPSGLGSIVGRAEQLQLLALRILGPQPLSLAVDVVRNDCARGLDDRFRRTVVLFETHDLCTGKVLITDAGENVQGSIRTTFSGRHQTPSSIRAAKLSNRPFASFGPGAASG